MIKYMKILHKDIKVPYILRYYDGSITVSLKNPSLYFFLWNLRTLEILIYENERIISNHLMRILEGDKILYLSWGTRILTT